MTNVVISYRSAPIAIVPGESIPGYSRGAVGSYGHEAAFTKGYAVEIRFDVIIREDFCRYLLPNIPIFRCEDDSPISDRHK